MKTTGLLVFGMIALAAAPSFAAEPTDADWAGVYAGISAGVTATNSLVTNTFPSSWIQYARINPASSGEMGQSVLGPNLSVGRNWQQGRFVYGLEADIGYLGLSQKRAATTDYDVNDPPLSYGMEVRDEVTALFEASLRARFGIAMGQSLFYVTGGVALTDFAHSHSWSEYGSNPDEVFGTGWCLRYNLCDNGGATEHLRPGLLLGLGGAVKLDAHWALTAEYTHTAYGTVRGQTQGYNPDNNEYLVDMVDHAADLTVDAFRIGISYAF